MDAVLAGVIGFVAIAFLLLKFDFRKVLYFDIALDITGTALLMVLFAGTYAGMTAALIGGALLSAFLYTAKKTIGYKRPSLHG